MTTRSRKLTGGAGGLLSYFEQLREAAAEDIAGYYSTRPPPRRKRDTDIVFDEPWGKAAERLGLDRLTRKQFTDLVNGEWDGEKLVGAGTRKVTDPETGEVRTERVRTSMIDVVWAAPKSVSEFLVACADDEELRAGVVEDFRVAVKAAFHSMEEHAVVALLPVATPAERGTATVQHGLRAGEESKMQGSRTVRVPAELLALPVVQFSARPTDETIARGSPPDPHLHMHTPLMGVCWVPDGDGARTCTPDEQGIRAQAAERHAVFLGVLARRLEDRGIPLDYRIDRKGNVLWEVEGSNPAGNPAMPIMRETVGTATR